MKRGDVVLLDYPYADGSGSKRTGYSCVNTLACSSVNWTMVTGFKG